MSMVLWWFKNIGFISRKKKWKKKGPFIINFYKVKISITWIRQGKTDLLANSENVKCVQTFQHVVWKL